MQAKVEKRLQLLLAEKVLQALRRVSPAPRVRFWLCVVYGCVWVCVLCGLSTRSPGIVNSNWHTHAHRRQTSITASLSQRTHWHAGRQTGARERGARSRPQAHTTRTHARMHGCPPGSMHAHIYACTHAHTYACTADTHACARTDAPAAQRACRCGTPSGRSRKTHSRTRPAPLHLFVGLFVVESLGRNKEKDCCSIDCPTLGLVIRQTPRGENWHG